MVLELCGGEPSKITVAGKPPKANRPFKFDLGLVERLSGIELEHRDIKRLLAALGILLDGKGSHV
jgi:phenylalanyl-tRNA synthetase beta chain